MKYLLILGVLTLIFLTVVLCSDDEYSDCPECVNNCPVHGCDCTDCDGNILTPKQKPPQPPRPNGCPKCVFECPLFLIKCGPPTTECTDEQLDTYVLKCPICDPEAGCQKIGCDCKDCDGSLLTPPKNPPQPPQQDACPACVQNCPISNIRCAAPKLCTDTQQDTYVLKCPDCVPQAGCKRIGCDCIDYDGNLLTPATNPPQPPRQEGCPACQTVCIQAKFKCLAPQDCTDTQIDTYVYKCPDCVPQAGCQQIGCDCKDCDGNLLTPPSNPPQPPRPDGCPKCSTTCIQSRIKCPAPVECTDSQLGRYVPKCPKCVNTCPVPGCDCTDCDGNLLTPPPPPKQPPRPKNCPACIFSCPLILVKCPAPTKQCTDKQLDTYVPKCPKCVDTCPVPQCECTDSDGNLLSPPPPKTQPPRPKNCPGCVVLYCPAIRITCTAPTTPCTDTQLDTYELKCPECVNTCPVPGCDCTDYDGNLLTPPPPKTQPPRPKNCPECIFECPLDLIKCPASPTTCTDTQLDTYVPKCPVCVNTCPEPGCDCTDCDGNLLTPPPPKTQPPRPKNCPACINVLQCPRIGIACTAPTTPCTDTQLDTYVLKCPKCVNTCPVPGCDCTDYDGNLLTPPPPKTQPPRPKNCPECIFECPLDLIKCPASPTTCTDTQLDTYVPKCPECVNTCPVPGCDCTDCDGILLTPPPPKIQPPRPKNCSACIFHCPLELIKCPAQNTSCTDTQLDTYVPKCPECVNTCPVPGCDCTDWDGNLLTPPPPPTQPPRPKNCPACVFHCPRILVKCPSPTNQCTDDQLDTYVPKCPACIPNAGCKQIGCDCLDSHGNVLTPPKNPPNPPRPTGCDPCGNICPDIKINCLRITHCTKKELAHFVPKCPECVSQAGCKQPGCDCLDDHGNLLTPPTNPPQPPRPPNCPKCSTACIVALVICETPTKCTKTQLTKYVPKCPLCVPQAGCQQLGCECYDRYGNSYVPPTNPPQPPRPVGCKKCPMNCIIPFVPCGKPKLCTKDQLKKYIPNPDDDDDDDTCDDNGYSFASATANANAGGDDDWD